MYSGERKLHLHHRWTNVLVATIDNFLHESSQWTYLESTKNVQYLLNLSRLDIQYVNSQLRKSTNIVNGIQKRAESVRE